MRIRINSTTILSVVSAGEHGDPHPDVRVHQRHRVEFPRSVHRVVVRVGGGSAPDHPVAGVRRRRGRLAGDRVAGHHGFGRAAVVLRQLQRPAHRRRQQETRSRWRGGSGGAAGRPPSLTPGRSGWRQGQRRAPWLPRCSPRRLASAAAACTARPARGEGYGAYAGYGWHGSNGFNTYVEAPERRRHLRLGPGR